MGKSMQSKVLIRVREGNLCGEILANVIDRKSCVIALIPVQTKGCLRSSAVSTTVKCGCLARKMR